MGLEREINLGGILTSYKSSKVRTYFSCGKVVGIVARYNHWHESQVAQRLVLTIVKKRQQIGRSI